jgi:hypothetical protein
VDKLWINKSIAVKLEKVVDALRRPSPAQAGREKIDCGLTRMRPGHGRESLDCGLKQNAIKLGKVVDAL